MKKILVLTAAILFVATSSFAATVSMGTFGDAGKTLRGAKSGTIADTSAMIGKTSTGVGVSMASAAVGYALATQHKSGSKAFASSFDSTSIYSSDVTTIGTKLIEVTTSDTSQFSSWTKM